MSRMSAILQSGLFDLLSDRRRVLQHQRHGAEVCNASLDVAMAGNPAGPRAGSGKYDLAGLQRDAELRERVREPRDPVGRMPEDRSGIAGFDHAAIELEDRCEIVER